MMSQSTAELPAHLPHESRWARTKVYIMEAADQNSHEQGTLPGKHSPASSAASDLEALSPDSWELISSTHGESAPSSRRGSLDGTSSGIQDQLAETEAAVASEPGTPIDMSLQASTQERPAETPISMHEAHAAVQEISPSGPDSNITQALPGDIAEGGLAAHVSETHSIAPSTQTPIVSSSEDEDEGQQLHASAAGSPTSAFSYSQAEFPRSGNGSSSFEHAGPDDDASSNGSWDRASSMGRAHSGKAKSEPDSEEALSELQGMSSEGPLSSTDHHPVVSRTQSAELPASPRADQKEGSGAPAAGSAEGQVDAAQVRRSLLALDPETARAAQDVLDSDAELFSELSGGSGTGSHTGSVKGGGDYTDEEEEVIKFAKGHASLPPLSVHSRAFRAILAWFQEG
ncbi:hypothetical protein WJX84_005368, partial [Apatococcus fuscideae]